MVAAIVFEVWDVFFSQTKELRSKLWQSLGVKDPDEIDQKMFVGEWANAYYRGEMSEEDYWKGIIDMLPFDYKGPWSSLCRLFERTVWLDSDLVTLSQYLKRRYDLYVLSNAGPELDRRLKHLELHDGLFQKVMSSYQMGRMKPDPTIYEKAIHEIGVPAGDILFVDSNYSNILSAKACGLYPYLYTNAQSFQQFFVFSQSSHQHEHSYISRRDQNGWKPFTLDGREDPSSNSIE